MNETLKNSPETGENAGGEGAQSSLPSSDKEWRESLDPEQYHVLREAGTERAFTGKYWDHKEQGTYLCAACGESLFESGDKYDSGSGWPSFDRPAADGAVTENADHSHGMIRTEVVCKNCQSHLGHVFPDGPKQTTGLRYCINSASLDFKKA